MDEVPAENQRALESMNWDDRLKEARAKREAVLRAKAAEKPDAEQGAAAPPGGVSLRTVETLRFGSVRGTSRPEVDTGTTEASAQRRRHAGVIAISFCAGFATAAGLWALHGQLSSEASATANALIEGENPSVEGANSPLEASKLVALLDDTLPPPVPVQTPVAPGLHESGGRIDLRSASFAVPQDETLPKVGPAALAPAPALLPKAPRSLAQGEGLVEVAATDPGLERLGIKGIGAPGASWSHRSAASDSKLRLMPAYANGGAGFAVASDLAPIRPDPFFVAYRSNTPIVPSRQPLALTATTIDTRPDRIAGTLGSRPEAGPTPRADVGPPQPFLPGVDGLVVRVFAAIETEDTQVDASVETMTSFGLATGPINRVSFEISQSQVRFYDNASAEAARILANRLNAIPRDFTGASARPPSGTLEIYLAGPASRSAPTVARVVPQPRPQINQVERLRQQVLSKLREGPSG